MADLAELEIRVDSKEAKKGADALDELGKASEKTAKSQEKQAKASRRSKKANEEVGDSAGKASQKTKTQKQQLKGFEAEARKAAKAAEKLAKAQARQAKTAELAAQKTSKMAKAMRFAKTQLLAVAAGFSAVLIATKAVSVIGDFEQSMATLTGVMRGSEMQMAALAKQAKELGATTRFSASQAAEAQLNLARAGLKQAQILAALPPVLNLAAGAQLDLGEASKITSQTLAQFGLNAMEAARVSDVLVGVSNRANTDVRQLGEAFAFAGAIASQMGQTLEGTAAAIGVLANSGIQASSAGTNLRGILLALAAPAGQARKKIAELAKASGQSVDAFDSTKNSILELAEAFAKAEAGPKDLVKIFGKLNTGAALILSKSVGQLKELTEASKLTNGEAQALADTMNNTLKGSFAGLISAIENLFLVLGDSGLLSVLRAITDALTIVIRSLGGADEKAGTFSFTAQVLAKILKLLLFTLKAYIAGLVAMNIKLIAARIATVGFNVALQGLKRALISTGIGILVVGLGELVAHFVTTTDAVDDMVKDMKRLKDASGDAADGIDKVTEAQKNLTKEQKKSLTPQEKVRAFYRSLRDEVKDLELELQKLRFPETRVLTAIKQLEQLKREFGAVGVASRQGARLEQGITGSLAQQGAEIDIARITALAQIRIDTLKAISREERKGSKTTKAASVEINRLADFWAKLNDQLETAQLSTAAKQLTKLREEFLKLGSLDAQALELPFDVDDIIQGFANIDDTLRKIREANEIKRIAEEGRIAMEQLKAAVLDVRKEVQVLALGPTATELQKVRIEMQEIVKAAEMLGGDAVQDVEALIQQIGKFRQVVVSAEKFAGTMNMLADSINTVATAEVPNTGDFVRAYDQINKATSDTAKELVKLQEQGHITQGEFSSAMEAMAVDTDLALRSITNSLQRSRLQAVADGILNSISRLSITLLFDIADVQEQAEAQVTKLNQKAAVSRNRAEEAAQSALRQTSDAAKIAAEDVAFHAKQQAEEAERAAAKAGRAATEATKEAVRNFIIEIQKIVTQEIIIKPILDLAGAQVQKGLLSLFPALGNAGDAAKDVADDAAEVSANAALKVAAADQVLAATGQTTAATAQTTAATAQDLAATGQTTAATAQTTAATTMTAAITTFAASVTSFAAAVAGETLGEGAAAIGDVAQVVKAGAANGAVYNDRTLAFASGGVVTSPIGFPLRGGGLGIAGEAGPEAILPAQRGSGGGFTVEADVAGQATRAEVQRMRNGRLGVKLFGTGGIVGEGETKIARPSAGGRGFPTQPARGEEATRATVVNMTVVTPNASSFKRGSRQIRKGIRRRGGV